MRVAKAQLPCMQHLAWKTFRQFRGVNLVAENGVADVMKMDPDLMSAATMQSALD